MGLLARQLRRRRFLDCRQIAADNGIEGPCRASKCGLGWMIAKNIRVTVYYGERRKTLCPTESDGMYHQPDFSRLFHEHFKAGEPRAKYELRHYGPNALHDVAFLSSLIHDALVRKSDVVFSDGTLAITLDRDCWESYDSNSSPPVLQSCQAEIRATHVEGVEWDSRDPPDKELCIDHLWLDESFRSHDETPIKVIMAGNSWRLTIAMARWNSRFTLIDLTDPA